jgi:hypothetical protein
MGGELTTWIQIRRSTSPKPRAPRGRERDGGERELCTGELNERKETRGGGRIMGRGRAPGQQPTTRTTTDRNLIVKRNPKRD